MRQRIAIVVSGTVAAAVLAVGLSAAGFGPGSGLAADEAPTADPVSGEPAATLAPEVVYVKPAPKPKTVVVTSKVHKSATPARSRKRTRSRTVRYRDDDGHERGHELREHERENDD